MAEVILNKELVYSMISIEFLFTVKTIDEFLFSFFIDSLKKDSKCIKSISFSLYLQVLEETKFNSCDPKYLCTLQRYITAGNLLTEFQVERKVVFYKQ
jgi:hypothetical protein